MYNVQTVNIQTKECFNTELRRDAEYHHDKTLCHSVRNKKVLQMQLLNEA